MLVYKQRYKPRTSRAFTKADLTVYDSASNTALNALTVYGKSEVVDGAIVSAGEGWAVVDLGTLTWTYYLSTESKFAVFTASVSNIFVPGQPSDRIKGLFCPLYPIATQASYRNMENKSMLRNNGLIAIKDDDYTDALTFKSAMSGVLLCYELADPTQGNCIAVKTDDGTGIDGTMAVVETGAPLRGIPDTTVRDVKAWDGSTGTVTKNCGEVDLGTPDWTRRTDNVEAPYFYTSFTDTYKYVSNNPNTLCANYSQQRIGSTGTTTGYFITDTNQLRIRDNNYTDATDFKTAMNGVKLVYELATPITEQLTTAENASIAGMRTFAPQTHAQNNAQTEMTVDYTIRVPTI